MDFDISGFGPIVGNFDIHQSLKWNNGNMKVQGKAESEKGWLTEKGLSPVKNDIQLDWERILTGHITNHFAGEKYQIVLDKNNVEINF